MTSSDSHCRLTHHQDASFLLFFHCRARFLISLGAGVLSLGHLAGGKSSLLCFSWPWGFGVDEMSKPRPGDQQEMGIRHRELGTLCVVREAGKESLCCGVGYRAAPKLLCSCILVLLLS